MKKAKQDSEASAVQFPVLVTDSGILHPSFGSVTCAAAALAVDRPRKARESDRMMWAVTA